MRRGDTGFTLIEMLLSLVLVSFALALAAQVLMETSQMTVDAAAEQVESSLPLARARLRADVQSCQSFLNVPGPGGRIAELRLLGHPVGMVRYRKVGRELRRDVSVDNGTTWQGETVALRGLVRWDWIDAVDLVALAITTERREIRHTPLPTPPGLGHPKTETRTERMVMAPRGAGLGDGW